MKKYLWILLVLLVASPAWAPYTTTSYEPTTTTSLEETTTTTLEPTTTTIEETTTTSLEDTTTSTVEETTTTTVEETTTTSLLTSVPTTSVRPTTSVVPTTSVRPTTSIVSTTTILPAPEVCIEGTEWAFINKRNKTVFVMLFEDGRIWKERVKSTPGQFSISVEESYDCETATIKEKGLLWMYTITAEFDVDMGTGQACMVGVWGLFWNVDGQLYGLPIPSVTTYRLSMR
jgi:hypothetical protein